MPELEGVDILAGVYGPPAEGRKEEFATLWLALDIETAKITPEGEDIQQHRPLGICCAALAWMTGGEVEYDIFFGQSETNGLPMPQMSQEDCRSLVERIAEGVYYRGFTLLTWNGLSFDMDVIAEESGWHKECAELAMSSVDPCSKFIASKDSPSDLMPSVGVWDCKGKQRECQGHSRPLCGQRANMMRC